MQEKQHEMKMVLALFWWNFWAKPVIFTASSDDFAVEMYHITAFDIYKILQLLFYKFPGINLFGVKYVLLCYLTRLL